MRVGELRSHCDFLLSRIFAATVFLGAISVLAGCAEIQLRMGTETEPSNIESELTLYVSTQTDVRMMYGPPDGVGAYVSPITGDYSTVWSYYFAKGTLKSMDDTFLFVYFDDDLYEGYLWFENTMSGEAGR